MSPNRTPLAKRALLHDLLKEVSRSFYLTLIVLPRSVRDPMGLAYLFARAADTIADTDLVDRERRLLFLKLFKAQFERERPNPDEILEIQAAVLPHQTQSAERSLLERLEDCMGLYMEFGSDDRERIRNLMQTLIPGMEMDLTVFSGAGANQPIALASMDDLDRYIYHVAGCVGEFWTRMMCAHRPSLAGWKIEEMAKVGVRFGKGLQLTNVLKDLARDLQRGRCYIPISYLKEEDLEPKDLLNRDNFGKLKPILTRLTKVALEHLDQGWLYTLAVPWWELRLRLACTWPILFAGHTLRRVASSPDLLDPTVNVKMPRSEIYCLMALTTLTGTWGLLWTAYWGRIRKKIV